MNSINLNQLPPSCQGFGNTFMNQRIPNPFYGIITDRLSSLSQTTVVRSQLLRPFPHYTGVTYSRPLVNMGISTYNSLQMKLQRRFAGGLAMLAHYTGSKMMDIGGTGSGIAFTDSTPIQNIYNIRDEYSLSNQDVPNRIVVSATHELPFGKGKRFTQSFRGGLQRILGGWQVNGACTWQSGTPLSIIAGNYLGIGNARMRASLVPGQISHVKVSKARASIRSGGTWFNTAAFVNPNDLAVPVPGEDVSKLYVLGNTSRTVGSVRRDNYRNLDFSLFKSFRITEQAHLQFRAESFNLFNAMVFGTPDTNVNSSQFGRITTQLNQPRKIQFSLRLTF